MEKSTCDTEVSGFLTISDLNMDNDNTPSVSEQPGIVQFIWLLSGRMAFSNLRGKEIILSGNELTILKQSGPYFRTSPNNAEGFSVIFNMAFLCGTRFVPSSLDNCTQSILYMERRGNLINSDLLREMSDITNLLIKELSSYLPYRQNMFRVLLALLIAQSARAFNKASTITTTNPDNRLADEFLKQVDMDFYSYRRVRDYARRMGVNCNHLNAALKKSTGYSAGHHIRQRVIKEIKKEAESGDISMKTLSSNFGFCDTSHFSKYFKQACGITYSTFKKSMRRRDLGL